MEPGVIGQSSHSGIVLATTFPALADKQDKLLRTPGAVYAAKAAALQFDCQAVIAREGMTGIHFVMEKRMAAKSVLMLDAALLSGYNLAI